MFFISTSFSIHINLGIDSKGILETERQQTQQDPTQTQSFKQVKALPPPPTPCVVCTIEKWSERQKVLLITFSRFQTGQLNRIHTRTEKDKPIPFTN